MITHNKNKMKIEKNKIVFASIIGMIVLFIGSYSMVVLNKDEDPTIETNRIPIPELQDEQKEYDSKLDAINDLKEVREANAPSIYDERMLDSSGVYDPDLPDKKKAQIVDSIYNQGRINYADNSYRKSRVQKVIKKVNPSGSIADKQDYGKTLSSDKTVFKDFFNSNPNRSERIEKSTDDVIHVVVNGDQVVKTFSRLEMRLARPALINNELLPKNTYLYGFVSFKPNRTMIEITNINHQPVNLKAYDLQDGNEGIYVVNNFQTEASKALVGDAVNEINIPAVPSVGVLKKVFQRSNRHVKVTIMNNYKLILKPKQ